MMKSDLQCPVDFIPVNEYKIRIVAGLVLAFMSGFLISRNLYIPIFLTGDFLLRTLNLGRLSLLGRLADLLVALFNVRNKPVDRAPKRFAAGTGFFFLVLVSISAIAGWQTLTLVLSLLVIVFASLESLAGFCAGCYMYHFLRKVFGKN